jgi:hypothetical protein
MFIAMSAYTKNTQISPKKPKNNDLMLHHKLPENRNKLNPKQAEGEK